MCATNNSELARAVASVNLNREDIYAKKLEFAG